MVRLVGHREPKGAATEMPHLSPPRQSSTLPICDVEATRPLAANTVEELDVGVAVPNRQFFRLRFWAVVWRCLIGSVA